MLNYDEKSIKDIIQQYKDDASKISLFLCSIIDKELQNTLNDTLTMMVNYDLMKISEFSLWNDTWNKYGIYGDKKKESRNKFSQKTYSRGRFLEIDYGHHNIGLEFSLGGHIGIVLKDFKGLIAVLPVTTDRGQTFPDEVKDAIIQVETKDYNQFHNNSLLLLHQIRAVGKNRIIKDLFKNISNTPLMEKVERKLFEIYSPYIYKEYKETLNKYEKIIEKQQEEISGLKQRIAELDKITKENFD